ncbi:lipoprotein-releasing ABC transporter permease subunit [Rheinheimera sp. WS51]|uniref:lipoprotein-releasing ABC transporter permease subunit n=1 Tax=Rheinheimera sp. WS51 TaxID=3425886 RepID=UPI003D8CFB6D
MANLAWQFARRYRSTSQSNGFIRFISASSTIGITLGVAILIVALSVMNGFEQALKQRLLSVIPHVELESVHDGIANWQAKLASLNQAKGVEAGAPYIKTNGMLRQGLAVKAVEVRGIAIEYEQRISDFKQYVVAGELKDLSATEIVLGQGVADALAVSVGDPVQLLLPALAEDGRLASYSNVALTVSAVIAIGGQLDYSQAWLDIDALAQLLDYPDSRVQGLAFRLTDIFSAPETARELGQLSTDYVYLLDWFRSQGHVYQDIQMVRTILYLVLALVIAVACFNIVATLVMAVREKQSDIAILLTMGMSKRSVIFIFICLGWLNGVVGTLLGSVIGVLLASNIEFIFAAISKLLGHSLLDPSIYFVNFVPSVLQLKDVFLTCLVALLMSLIATFYPALRASKVQPAAVLGQK